jgi:integrase
MSRGTIRRRGKTSWELKFDVGVDAKGKRKTRYVTVKGTRQDAQKELTRLLAQADTGALPDPCKLTVREYIVAWIGESPKKDEAPAPPPADLSPKTVERYRQLAEHQIYPHLGSTPVQKLRPAQVRTWQETLLKSGSVKGKPLAARTVGHAYRVLHRALERGVEAEALARNVAGVIGPPKVEDDEVGILQPDELATLLAGLAGHDLNVLAHTAVGTGMRRGELLALAWPCVDLEKAQARVERSLEETTAGLRFKPPKNRNSRRTISLPASVIPLLREHRRKQLELRVQLGLGKLPPDALVFCEHDGRPLSPDDLSWRWRNTCRDMKLPSVSFHALRHTHASALIAAGIDVVKISKRLGHSSPTVTLRIYAHLFKPDDEAAAVAIDAVMR